MIVSQAGTCIFEYQFTPMKIDPQLTAGFTVAFNSFSASLMERAQIIESIKMSELQFIISKFKGYFLLIVVNKYDRLQDYDSLIVNLENIFLEKFGTVTEDQYNQISIFFPFQSVVKNLCRSMINIAIIGNEFEGKTEIWQYLTEFGTLTDQSKYKEISLVQVDNNPELPNCAIRIWKVDADQNIDSFFQVIENKNILILLIPPTLNHILKIIPKLLQIRQRIKNVMMYGICLRNYGGILKSNIETMLDLKIIEVNLSEGNIHKRLGQFLIDCVMGLL